MSPEARTLIQRILVVFAFACGLLAFFGVAPDGHNLTAVGVIALALAALL